jgi:hypothetical protein
LKLERTSVPCRRGRGGHLRQTFAHNTSSHAAEKALIEDRFHTQGTSLGQSARGSKSMWMPSSPVCQRIRHTPGECSFPTGSSTWTFRRVYFCSSCREYDDRVKVVQSMAVR